MASDSPIPEITKRTAVIWRKQDELDDLRLDLYKHGHDLDKYIGKTVICKYRLCDAWSGAVVIQTYKGTLLNVAPSGEKFTFETTEIPGTSKPTKIYLRLEDLYLMYPPELEGK